MKLREVIKYLDALARVEIYQSDMYIDKTKEKDELIYKGSILDIPWYITEMYLDNDSNGEAISVYEDHFVIYVREKATNNDD